MGNVKFTFNSAHPVDKFKIQVITMMGIRLLFIVFVSHCILVASISFVFQHLTTIMLWQKYEVEFLLQQQWFDPRLRYYNQSRYPFLNAIHHHESIWLPDTYFIMHGDFKDPLIPVHFALRIYQNGSVTYLMRSVLPYTCTQSSLITISVLK